MTSDEMEYMVWVIEKVAAKFFQGDKTLAYNALKRSGIWELYTAHYETTHTLGLEYILEEIGERFEGVGII